MLSEELQNQTLVNCAALHQDQNPTSPVGKRPTSSKMAEGAKNITECSPESNPPTPHLENRTEEHERPFTSPQPTREVILNQRRQKCELKRLLKHTCPELKNVDSLVEEELADILNINPATDSGFQSDVHSRCWMFEKHENSSEDSLDQNLHVNKDFQEGDFKRTVCMFEQPTSNPLNEENKPQLDESEEVTPEQSIRVDVKATRRMFETQSIDILRDIQSPCPRKNEDKCGLDQKPKHVSETNGKETPGIHHKPDIIDANEVFAGISRAKQVFENISHDKENIPPTNNSITQEEEMLKANVRNRAQMFESTPLDKINLQTKEESETILEDMQETLLSLCNFSIIHSDGSILEANESGHVKKARYHFIEDTRAVINEEEIVTGSIKSIMLQMLPGTNFNPTVTFLKEDSQGNVEILKVDVPIHQLPFTQDKECRTANVVQITEDLLGQEESLRKGVLIQDGATGIGEITVYALFIHSKGSTGLMGFGKIEGRSISSSLSNGPASKKINLKQDVNSSESALVVETGKTSNVQLIQGSVKKEEPNHQETEISESTGQSEKTGPCNVNNIKSLLSTSTDQDENKSKVAPAEMLLDNKTNTEEMNQFNNLKNDGILQDQGIYEDGAVLQAELVDVVEDDELVNLQTAIKNLHQATMEAKALQQSVQAKQSSQTKQNQQICDPGSENQEFTQYTKTNENGELSQISKNEEEESDKEEVMRGSIQAALDSLGKSNFNVTKGDFRAAMIYRNSGKGYAGHKKIDVELSSNKTKDNISLTSPPVPPIEQEQSPGEGHVTTPCENKPMTCSPLQVSIDTAPKNPKTPRGPKPALPPKPDHLKIKPNSPGTQSDLDHHKQPANARQTSPSKPPTEQIKEPSSPKPNPDSTSHKDVNFQSVQNTDSNNHKPGDTSVSNTESPEEKTLQETPKSSPECTASESSTGFHATLQNFRVKPSGSVPPVKPKRIKMAKENAMNIAVNSTALETETAQGIPSSQDNGETSKIDSSKHEEISDDQQVDKVVRREKKMRGETEDERRQRLSVHMDEIMKGNVPAVMEIFDKLKQQEELKSILSKVEEIEEDTHKVDVSSLRNIFENVPDWVVPQEQPKITIPEDLESLSEPETMTSMEVAFGDLEKAGADIIRLKDQTLERLMDIEEAIKKALYSVSTLKSDSDIVGLSGLFRESMVAVQGSPPSGNIRKISIGSSKSPKALKQIGRSQQSIVQKKPELIIPTTKPRSASPGSPSFISIQSAARKPSELPSPLKEDPKERPTPQCCCSVPSDRRQCSVTKSPSTNPANPQRQVSVLEVKTMPEGERVIGTKTIKENYERTDSFGNKFYSSKTSTVVTTQPETRTTSRKLIMSNPTMSEIVTYPRINTPLIREDHPPL
ncbi:LIM domain-containing protein isoform X2 [Danio rerio]|uniref:LIM domain-containing protein isoform X2 n=1 Tax=Danio rerio TaxID=7955 RepID=A0A8M9P640_DANRE|nr:xin actin-binding repeat-containing protein 1-like isoform X2 [Danio rerio]|eukprot:XP_021325982.1 xin actin-binding repeat-containing protein 1-like isoform X2 [Danio rerio]